MTLTPFITRKLVLLIGLMSMLSIATSDKTIVCSFSNIVWLYFKRSFRTCNVHNQAIDTVGFTLPSVDSTVRGFDIRNIPEVKFLPENLSEKFPSLVAAQFWSCSIKSINENHFKGLHDLIVLSFDLNKIERIDSNAFKDNVKLEYFGLSGNNIKYLTQDLFSSLRNL
jgi:hypothetical protein